MKQKRKFASVLAALIAVAVLSVPAGALTYPATKLTPIQAVETNPPEEEIADTEESAEEDGGMSEMPVEEKEKPEGEKSGPEILAGSKLIAHGMGETGGVTTLNCLEGFLAQYEAGTRVFEADIRLTRDAKAVLRHDWRGSWQEGVNEASIPTRDEFVSKKILGQYTPLSFRDLLLLMEQYPDICIITDTKFTEPDVYMIEFDAMTEDARELGLSYLFDRIIVQVYHRNMFTALNNAYGFPHYIYTLYNEGFAQTESAFREKAEFCCQHGIGGITMWDYWWNKSYAAIAEEYGIRTYAHTVNDAAAALELLETGVDALYTDCLTFAHLEAQAMIPVYEPEAFHGEDG